MAFPAGIRHVGDWAFVHCTSLKVVTFGADALPDEDCGFNVFIDVASDAVAIIPDGATGYRTDSEGKWRGLFVVQPDWLVEHRLVAAGAGRVEVIAAAKDNAANPRYKVWEMYQLGLDPTDPQADFFAVLTPLPNGKVSVMPNEVRPNVAYRVLASETPDFQHAEERPIGVIDNPSLKFFKIKGGLK